MPGGDISDFMAQMGGGVPDEPNAAPAPVKLKKSKKSLKAALAEGADDELLGRLRTRIMHVSGAIRKLKTSPAAQPFREAKEQLTALMEDLVNGAPARDDLDDFANDIIINAKEQAKKITPGLHFDDQGMPSIQKKAPEVKPPATGESVPAEKTVSAQRKAAAASEAAATAETAATTVTPPPTAEAAAAPEKPKRVRSRPFYNTPTAKKVAAVAGGGMQGGQWLREIAGNKAGVKTLTKALFGTPAGWLLGLPFLHHQITSMIPSKYSEAERMEAAQPSLGERLMARRNQEQMLRQELSSLMATPDGKRALYEQAQALDRAAAPPPGVPGRVTFGQ